MVAALELASNRTPITLPPAPFAYGSEASLYRKKQWALKIFNDPLDENTTRKLILLTKLESRLRPDFSTEPKLCCPVDAIRRTQDGKIVGSVAPWIDGTSWGKLCDPIKRDAFFPNATFSTLVEMGINLVTAVEKAHAEGLVHGDLSPSNVIVRVDGRTILIDMEGSQYTSRFGETFACYLGTPGYLAPEIAREADYSVIRRKPSHDCFSAATLLYELFTSFHPSSGTCRSFSSKPPLPLEKRVEKGLWHLTRRRTGYRIDPDQRIVSSDVWGPEIDALFRRTFDDGFEDSSQRPSLNEWSSALKNLEMN